MLSAYVMQAIKCVCLQMQVYMCAMQERAPIQQGHVQALLEGQSIEEMQATRGEGQHLLWRQCIRQGISKLGSQPSFP